MHMKMILGVAAIATLSSAGMQDDTATDAKALAAASKLFAQSCVKCHTAPDTRFAGLSCSSKWVYSLIVTLAVGRRQSSVNASIINPNPRMPRHLR